jgi:hypothetical protein
MSRISRSRIEESRSLEERSLEQKRVFDMDWNNPYYIPPQIIPSDKVYFWLRASIRDIPDHNRTTFAANTGWSAVPLDRHPELSSKTLFGENKISKNYIERTGLILCEKSKHLHLAEQAERSRKTAEQLGSLQGLDTPYSDRYTHFNKPDIRVSYTKEEDRPSNRNNLGNNVQFSW